MRRARAPQNLTQSDSGSSGTTTSNERLPTNALLSTMLSRIQLDTLPHTTNTNRGCALNRSSHAFFRTAAKVLSSNAIQDISSRRTTVLCRFDIAASRRTKAEYQSSGTVFSPPTCDASFVAKNFNWSAFVMPGSGRNPSNFMNRACERRANSLTRVDFPIRRRPLHVTKEAVRFSKSDTNCPRMASRPKNIVFFMARIISNRRPIRQRQSPTYFAF